MDRIEGKKQEKWKKTVIKEWISNLLQKNK
jgi:hypothetical protein